MVSSVGRFFVIIIIVASTTKILGHWIDHADAAPNIERAYGDEPLYSCPFSYFPLPASWTRLTLHHLASLVDPFNRTNKDILEQHGQRDGYDSLRLSYDTNNSEIDMSTIDPTLPFTFFIHGFNHNQDTLNMTWMDSVASVFEHYFARDSSRQRSRSNVIFVKWYVKTLFADSSISVIPTYYKTMANYEIILDYVVNAIVKLIDYVEQTRGGWDNEEARSRYFSQFKFYGHSLGAHIIAHAVSRVKQAKPYVKFGKLVGLDPSLPCFPNENYGISGNKIASATNQVIIVHAHAGFTGVEKARAPTEIVLNGGTFQPSCSWYEMGCHHMRVTQILNYIDDRCQMVAYRCNKYEQFKLGACETCEQAHADTPNDFGCILVNLPEQHIDSEILISDDDDETTRQLADEDNYETMYSKVTDFSSGIPQLQAKTRNPFYHFVNTNPDYSSSHCLQHYQMRLLILNESSSNWQQSCPLTSFFLENSKKIKLQLFFEPAWKHLKQLNLHKNFNSSRQNAMNGRELDAIIAGKLHTGLLTYDGKPEVFVGATIDNVDFKRWSRCLSKLQNSDDEKEFQIVLDMAFMSNVKKSIRHMYSSVLCGQWNPRAYQNDHGFVLNLCKQSELIQVSERIDDLLKQIKFEHQYESWQISLLNSLFSLYAEWDPLR